MKDATLAKSTLWIFAILLLLLLSSVMFLLLDSDYVVPSIDNLSTDTPAFEMRVLKPRSARPLFGILPDGLFGLPPKELQFNSFAPSEKDTKVAEIGRHYLAIGDGDWSLYIETNENGEITANTQIVFPIELGERLVTLRCHAEPDIDGYLNTDDTTDLDAYRGTFLVKISICENAVSNKSIEWPPRPLTVYGAFDGLQPNNR